jgi:quinolinate synthase
MTLQSEIETLKRDRDAVILAHYYTRPEVQDVADYIGDSFFLSQRAVELSNQTIVFCGVAFMGESAKILNPQKTVLMPDAQADCPMAHMVYQEMVEKTRETCPDLAVVCYINSTAAIKACSDVCVTSANAVKIVAALPNKNILFIPDRNLGHYIDGQIPEKHFIYNEGYCPIHEKIAPAEVEELKTAHPEAPVLAHPECPAQVLDQADFIGSTTAIIKEAGRREAQDFIICTESGVRYMLEKDNPQKMFYFPATEPICADMKTITLSKIASVLKTGANAVSVPDDVREKARLPLERMLELGR